MYGKFYCKDLAKWFCQKAWNIIHFGYYKSTFNSVLRDAQQINLLSFDAISWSRVMDEFHKKETMYKHSFLNPCFSQWWICVKIHFEGESWNHIFLWNGVIYELKQKVNCLCLVRKSLTRGILLHVKIRKFFEVIKYPSH